MTQDPIFPVCANWWNPNGFSTDYFSAYCNQLTAGYGSQNCLPFDISFGNQEAFDGVSCLALVAYESTGDTKEYAQGFLSVPMESGQTYCVSLWLTLADSSALKSCDFQVGFTNELVNDPNATNLQLTNAVIFDISQIESNQWFEFQGVYVATGGEQYIYLGSNNPNELMTCVEQVTTSWAWNTCYLLADLVSVVPAEGCADLVSEIVSFQDQFSIFPNPNQGKFTIGSIASNRHAVRILNPLGKVAFMASLNSTMNTIDVGHLSPGVYVLEISDGKKLAFYRIILE